MTLDMVVVVICAVFSLSIAAATIFLKSYINEKAKNLASKQQFNDLRNQLIENTDVTHKLEHKAQARKEGMNEVLLSMSEIESSLSAFVVFIYFRIDESDPNFENIGREDLRKTVDLMMNYQRVISRYRIYFGEDIFNEMIVWMRQVYDVLYKTDTVYLVSIDYHQDKDVEQGERLDFISKLYNKEVKPLLTNIGLRKNEINQKLIDTLDVKL